MGSFQEMAYYFTNDRGLIMVIGIMYGLQCMLLTSYCLYFVMKYFTLMIDSNLDAEDLKSTLWFNVIFGVTIVIYIATSWQTNFQNYYKLPFLIHGFLAYSLIFCVIISIVGNEQNWKVNEMMPYLYRGEKLSEDEDLPDFIAPSFSMVPIICSSFHFQFFLL